jgi:hypothetical protein
MPKLPNLEAEVAAAQAHIRRILEFSQQHRTLIRHLMSECLYAD